MKLQFAVFGSVSIKFEGTVFAVANIHKMLLATFPGLSAVYWPMDSTVFLEREAFRVGNGFSR